jgi:electron transport complex protein RnfG
MKENTRMLVVLTLICSACGFLLAGVENATKDRIEEQVLKNVQGPAVQQVLAGAENDLIADRKKVTVGDKEVVLFVAKKGGVNWAVAYETFAGGFGGDLGVVVGYNLTEDRITGIGITTAAETPGIGLRIKEDAFTDRFKDKTVTDKIDLKNNGGVIDGISGATVSSVAVCDAVRKNIEMYQDIKTKVAGSE